MEGLVLGRVILLHRPMILQRIPIPLLVRSSPLTNTSAAFPAVRLTQLKPCRASSSQALSSAPENKLQQLEPVAPVSDHSDTLIDSSSSLPSQLYRQQPVIDKRFLECCEPGHKLNVGVLLSGGVDSSIALRLLLAAGHSCTAFYLKIWFQEDFENFWSACPWDEDLKFAQAVCDEVGVKLIVVQLTEEYWKYVVTYMISEYQIGRTPNPDILCNSRIKFGVFLEHVKNMGFDRVASGHYAKVVRVGNGSNDVQAVLKLSTDEVKDQTYFLTHLSQSQLLKLMFPLGCVSKAEVRQIAEKFDLPNKQRKDSQGICFLGKVKFSDFIGRHLGEKEGQILEAESGKWLGTHKGFWFYTIGQRQGLRLSHGPWYVVDKDLENNVVFVSNEYFSPEKKRRVFEVDTINWITGHPPDDLSGLRCKVRHGPKFYGCNLSFKNSDGNSTVYTSALVELSDDDQGIAAGQYAAFYKGDECLGSGIISEFKIDKSSAVSAKAREAAKLKTPTLELKSKSKKKKAVKTLNEEITTREKDDATVDASAVVKKWMKSCLQWFGL